MKITINTQTETIQIHGSYAFGELEDLYKKLPKEWKSFKFEHPEFEHPEFEIRVDSYPQIPYIPYPVQPYPIQPWYTSTGDPVPGITGPTCKC